MQGYILRRLLATIPTVLVVALFTFFLLRITPGDPASVIGGIRATPEQVAAIRANLGLDKPMVVQLFIWLGQLLRGDLGDSIFSDASVASLILSRMRPTVALTVVAQTFAVGVAIPLGVLAGWKPNSWVDRSVMVFATLGWSVPVFWLGFLLIWVFSLKLSLLPVLGYTPLSEGLGSFILHLILPSFSVGLIVMALLTRMTRATVVEVMQEDYVRTARAKGLGERIVLMRHALRPASLPILTIVGIGFGGTLTGAVIIESVFAIPGIGRLVVDALLRRDYPVIQGTVILVAVVYVFVNLVVDVGYAYLDPRIRY